jgi:hypothetical protein
MPLGPCPAPLPFSLLPLNLPLHCPLPGCEVLRWSHTCLARQAAAAGARPIPCCHGWRWLRALAAPMGRCGCTDCSLAGPAAAAGLGCGPWATRASSCWSASMAWAPPRGPPAWPGRTRGEQPPWPQCCLPEPGGGGPGVGRCYRCRRPQSAQPSPPGWGEAGPQAHPAGGAAASRCRSCSA